jgi:hypothetical protein
MSVIKKMRKQKCVYWPPGVSDPHGQPTFGDPVEMRCRWEESAEQYIDAKGETRISKAIVYVESPVEIDGLLRKLAKTETIGNVNASDPWSNEGVYEIRRYDELPDFKAKEFLMTAWV